MNLIEAFQKDFTTTCTNSLSKQVMLGTEVFNKFLHENKQFFSYPQYSSLRGYLLNYSIQKALYDVAFVPSSTLQAIPMNVNNYGCSVLHLKTEHFQVTTSKTTHWSKLPSKSIYKLQYAKANSNGDGQLFFNFEDQIIASQPYYALLTYGYNTRSQECSHIDLVVPDEKFKNIIHRQDLFSTTKNNFLILPSNNEVEETVAKLNSEFENIVQLKLKRIGE